MSLYRIMVVDDEEAMRESLAGWLMQDGYQVGMAPGGVSHTPLVPVPRQSGISTTGHWAARCAPSRSFPTQ